jgi:hypothetical protein
VVNTLFLVVPSDATDGTGEGDRRGGWFRDTSRSQPGQTACSTRHFGGSANFGTSPGGDDLIYVLRDDTR